MTYIETQQDLLCYHCGLACENETTWLEEKPFCCSGCKTVFEILDANNLCEYYALDKTPGITIDQESEQSFSYLDERAIRKKILTFDSPEFAKASFYVPAIHCVSCIWLLENLKRLDVGILRSEVNFARKKTTIDFNPQKIQLSRVAALLTSVGYVPQIHLEENPSRENSNDQSLVTKLAIAAFCFGNIMLFSFPEYLGLNQTDHLLFQFFSWLNLILSWPVFFYSGFGYLQSAFKSFKQRQINIDVPIAAGLIALFLRSHYDILSATGSGYLDSFTGLVFFLLIGRWFQSKTYESLSFERDFKSYFPLAVNKFQEDDWKPVVIYELQKGDIIRIRNMEIVPADSILKSDKGLIDYSFVTGESKPVNANPSDMIYAGGRVIGAPITLVVDAKTSQSNLTSLWNNEAFRKREENHHQKIIDRAARKFTWAVMGIALITALYWYWASPTEMWLVFTSVLMVACPCALALAAPFTYGSMLRVFGRHQLYLKHADVIERMANIDVVVFDKTGTVTYNQQPNVQFTGDLNNQEITWVKSLTICSTHPLSNMITKSIDGKTVDVDRYHELPGKGIMGLVDDHLIKIGSANFIGAKAKLSPSHSFVFVSIDDDIRGYFSIALTIRKNLKPMLDRLGHKCEAVLSGDNEKDRNKMKVLFGCHVQMLFNQSPLDKLEYIRNIQLNGKKVLMVGDGLNDAGALKQANVGIAVTDDTGVFTPACDGILQGGQLQSLDKLLALAKSSSTILKASFGLSFFYNAIALSFAVSGNLSPLVAAILMPISSISVVGFASLAVRFVAARKLSQP